MASVTPAAGESGFVPHLSGGPTNTVIVSRNPMPARPAAPAIERVGSVRILRGTAGWRGVALRLANPSGDDERFELALTAGDGRSIVVACAEEADAVALWRDFGRASGLPLLLETADGTVTAPFPQIGRLALGPVRIRRRHGLLNGRRPRFLTRRKTGRLADLPVVVSGERLTD
ncbi:hypothetical protein ARD30_21965 [Bosea thiooxidans]|uniref:Uncharacterized protein n=1 Tax=Bosea thiooxidans TaxID=53254 RepID=A0A0Q3KF24_9HYPH|nr:DUF6101 family protein [Bosea thiooxidans]KQK28411.1 hypothetical protein ARD30_21965 [Bosea thiooxidans]SKB67152.1 hypothetical protein SAMN05660750_01759 [Bosea thiooxidans]